MKKDKLVLASAVLLALLLCFPSALGLGSTNAHLMYVSGTRIAVPVGSTVYVYTTVKAVGGSASGTLTVQVRKDFQDYPDSTYVTFSKQIYVPAGETQTFYMGSFKAVDLTGSPWWAPFRQYFVRVYFNGNLIYNPTDPTTRECVETYSTSSTVSYSQTTFGASQGHLLG